MTWELPQSDDAAGTRIRVEPSNAEAEALELMRRRSLVEWIESQIAYGASPEEIAAKLNRTHGLRVSGVFVQHYIDEELPVMRKVRQSTAMRAYVEQNQEMLAEQVPTDLGYLDEGIRMMADIVARRDPDVCDEDLGPKARLAARTKAARELGCLIQIKYDLTGEPIKPKPRDSGSKLTAIAIELYGPTARSLPARASEAQVTDAPDDSAGR